MQAEEVEDRVQDGGTETVTRTRRIGRQVHVQTHSPRLLQDYIENPVLAHDFGISAYVCVQRLLETNIRVQPLLETAESTGSSYSRCCCTGSLLEK